jgi:hypothetical protein
MPESNINISVPLLEPLEQQHGPMYVQRDGSSKKLVVVVRHEHLKFNLFSVNMSETYKLIRLLGSGAFGKCYQVRSSTGEINVIKQINMTELNDEE